MRSALATSLMRSEVVSCDRQGLQGTGERPSRRFRKAMWPQRGLAGSDRPHEWLDAHDPEHPFEVIGENMEAHLGSHVVQRAGQD